MRRFAVLLLACLALAACSKQHVPPTGRWIGHFESPSVMVVAWLEILPSGDVRVSAPDYLDIGEPSDEARDAAHKKLSSQLSDDWGQIQPRRYDFDGHTFRKKGGVAPQMEWNPKTQEMKLVFYFGMQRSMHIPMTPVKEFNEDSWLP